MIGEDVIDRCRCRGRRTGRTQRSGFESLGSKRRLRVAVIEDDAGGENLRLGHTSTFGARVARELNTLVRLYGKPACIVSVSGAEFTVFGRDLCNTACGLMLQALAIWSLALSPSPPPFRRLFPAASA